MSEVITTVEGRTIVVTETSTNTVIVNYGEGGGSSNIGDYVERINGATGVVTLAGKDVNYISGRAGFALEANRVVKALSFGFVYADKDNPDDAGVVLGFTQASAGEDDPIRVITSGVVSDNSWNLYTDMPVYLGSNGTITQIAPTTGFVLVVGKAVSSNSILVSVSNVTTISDYVKKSSTIAVSTGPSDIGKIPKLGIGGRLSGSMMPIGVGANTASVRASENLLAGDYVNIWNNIGSFSVRRASASVVGKEAHGYVLSNVGGGDYATVYFSGNNTQVVGQQSGRVWLSTTDGEGTSVPPNATGNIQQLIGVATAEDSVNFNCGEVKVV